MRNQADMISPNETICRKRG